MNVIACVPLESFSSLDFLLKDHSHFVDVKMLFLISLYFDSHICNTTFFVELMS